MARWQGSGLSETSFPIVDMGLGLAPRVQLGVTAPRVAGGLGTVFFTTKFKVLTDDSSAAAVALAPTLAIQNGIIAPGQGRAEWGLPVSAHLDRWNSRIYGGAGYFSPGIWYVGAGVGRSLSDRFGVSASLSHAWATLPEQSSGVARTIGEARDELSGGASYELMRGIGVFGSITRTLGITAEDGGGTALGVGLSWSTEIDALSK
jgi:hypothetical protein